LAAISRPCSGGASRPVRSLSTGDIAVADPLVSVIISTCNRAHYLPEAIDSVRAQIHRAYELIVVDDGSSDETPSLLRRLEATGVRCLRQPNRGVAVARNQGVQAARGELIAFLDDDDLWLPDKLARQVAVLRQAPETAAVYGHAQQFVSPELNAAERARLAHLEGRVVPAPIATALLVRRAAWARIGPFDETLNVGVEMDWYARLCDLGLPKVMLDAVVYRRRLHRSNLNRATQGDQSERLRVLKQVLDRRRRGEQGSRQ
jgi:glycosyltransferase involved in cell wall biosynthesis